MLHQQRVSCPRLRGPTAARSRCPFPPRPPPQRRRAGGTRSQPIGTGSQAVPGLRRDPVPAGTAARDPRTPPGHPRNSLSRRAPRALRRRGEGERSGPAAAAQAALPRASRRAPARRSPRTRCEGYKRCAFSRKRRALSGWLALAAASAMLMHRSASSRFDSMAAAAGRGGGEAGPGADR